jgi:L-amino acid N-acyltransferase YncA/protein-tyrosine-phosphatase
MLHIRNAETADLDDIRRIYNEGIEDRIATVDETPKDAAEMALWWSEHDERFAIIIARDGLGQAAGWAALNTYSHRCAFRGVADLSVYVARDARRTGVGSALLAALERHAKRHEFHKIVLFTFAGNASGQALYRKFGYREVGVFHEQGILDGAFVDVMAMEKILRPSVLFVCRHNTGRSQMAEAYLRHFLGDGVEVASGGTIAADVPDPGVIAIMAEDGIDISGARPKLIDTGFAQRADRIITMGCDVEGVERIDDDWGLPDPKGQPARVVREIRDQAKTKVEGLVADLRRR